MTEKEMKFLCRRMTELREKNGVKSLQAMVERLQASGHEIYNKSTLSRVEKGDANEKTLEKWAKAYCKEFGLSELQTEQFFRGEKIAVPDTSALLKNPQLIDELDKEYSKIVIPDIVLMELNNIKNKFSDARRKRAWEIIRGIGYGERIIKMDYNGDPTIDNNDLKIISVAKSAAEKYGCEVHIITDDSDFTAILKYDDNDNIVKPLHLREYMVTKQNLINMVDLVELDKYFADSYDDIKAPEKDEINAYLPDGLTLIISAVLNKDHSFEQRKAKIQWLIAHGADVNKRDCQRVYFPPISHAIQEKDYKMFSFLLKECHADPNIGSRNPHDSGKVRQKNEGNMPLMVAAWHGRENIVKDLCNDPRTSINQQDANGFTALIKACANDNKNCAKILFEAGADIKIVDIDGKTAEDRYNECIELGPLKYRFRPRKNKRGKKW